MSEEVTPSNTSLDEMFDVLRNPYRRRLLVALLDHNPQEEDDPQIPADVSMADDDLDLLQVQMQHVHLPKLVQIGFVEWDEDANTVSKGPRFDEIRPLLELMRDHADELPDDWL